MSTATYAVSVPCILCRDGGQVQATVSFSGRGLSLVGRAVLGERSCSHELSPLGASLTKGRAIDVAAAMHVKASEPKEAA
jgi:hypothetical protein